MSRFLAFATASLLVAACSDDATSSSQGAASGASGTGGSFASFASGSGAGTGQMFPELWYSVDQLLVLVSLAKDDGSVASIESSTITLALDAGQTAITMLADGSLLAERLVKTDLQSHFFHIPNPPRDGSDVTPVSLGVMPGGIMLEGLYTDCDGRLYGMDTGVDDTSAQGNRLLRFTGDVTAGDFAFTVVSDLATAVVADIDDMSPGIANNTITDNPGLAIDTGNIYAFNYETGTGTQVAQAGTFGIHALGGALFSDNRSRLYVLNDAAQLFELDPVAFSSSGVLGTGPTPSQGPAGWSALAGPLTDCQTGFAPPK